MLLFEAPAALLLLIVVPLLAWLRHAWRRRGGQVSFPFAIWQGKGFVATRSRVGLLLATSSFSFWAGVVLLIVALAGPQRVTRERVFVTRGVDFMLVIDQSPTMAARDFTPENRFESAREVVRRFVQRRENDAVGLVGFGAEAALRVPPTVDYDHLLAELDRMQVLGLGDGTAIGMGIAVAALHLERSAAPLRAIILVTDGINNAGEIEPETAARAAASLGIDLYVIGIGSGSEVELELQDPETGQTLRGTVRDGFDEEALRRIAAAGGGTYAYAGSNTVLESVFTQIDTSERVEHRSLIRVNREPRDRRFVLLALALVLLDVFVRRVIVREIL